MNVKLIGYSYSAGISKAGKPYSIPELITIVPHKGWSNASGQNIGAGFDVNQSSRIKFDPKPDFVSVLNKLQYPCDCELVFSPDPENYTRNIVTGLKVL